MIIQNAMSFYLALFYKTESFLMITISSCKKEGKSIVEQVILKFNLFVDFHNEMTYKNMVYRGNLERHKCLFVISAKFPPQVS